MLRKGDEYVQVLSDDFHNRIGMVEYRKLLKDYEAVTVDLYSTEDVVALCCVEIKEMLRLGRTVRECRNCHNYFIPNRADEIYCPRVQRTTHRKEGGKYVPVGVTCQDDGPQKRYRESLKHDPIKLTYRRAYKRNHARMDKCKLIQSQFDAWVLEARSKMAEAEAGKMTAEEFETWTRR